MRTGPSPGTWWSRSWPCDESAARCPPGSDLDRRMIRLRLWAAWFLANLGDSTAQAILIGEPLVADQERVLGPDHPDTLAARNNLAIAYRAAGRTRRGDPAARADPGRPASGSWARTTPTPWPRATTSPTPTGRRAARPRRSPARADPGRPGAGPGPGPPRHPDLAQQPRHRLPGRGPHGRGDHACTSRPWPTGSGSWARTTPTP